MLRFLRNHSLKLILLAGLLHGLLYVFIVPPWQHNDEPTHFEYAWLIANRPGLPKSGEYDQTMRREVAVSMLEHHFFQRMESGPDLDPKDGPIWIGISQLDDRPFYYLLVSLPLRFLTSLDITGQLYAARSVSLILFLLTILAAAGTMKELTSENSPLRWLMPLSLVLVPGFIDLMTAVNNDVGATMFFSFFLWGSVRMVRKGVSILRLFWVLGTAALCFLTKNTAILALPLAGLALILALFRNRWRWAPYAALAAAIPVLLVSVFYWGDARFWMRSSADLQTGPNRTLSAEAPLGRHVLQMTTYPEQPSPEFYQLLPTETVISCRGKTVTFGTWIWATEPLAINAFTLHDGQSDFSQAIQVTTTPQFIAKTVTFGTEGWRARITLAPGIQAGLAPVTVYYDGMVLVEDAPPLDQAPEFADPNGSKGMWGGKAFTNLLRNASVEQAEPGFRAWVQKIGQKYGNEVFQYVSPSMMLGSLLDWPGAGWYYQGAATNILRTFWAKFGWNEVPLNISFIHKPYQILTFFTLAGFLGAVLALWRLRSKIPWNAVLFLLAALAGVWGLSILRGVHSLFYTIFVPSARYAFPVIIPTLLILNAGWLEIGGYLDRWTHIPAWVKFTVYCLLFLALDIASLVTIVQYFSVS